MTAGKHSGWYQVAFERDLGGDITSAAIGEQRLILVRRGDSVRCFSAVCPHRGADLGQGECLAEAAVACPFHGFRIGLDGPGDYGFRAPEYQVLVWGGMVFARLTEGHDNGLAAFFEEHYHGHYFVPGFEIAVRVSAELVIENGFDAAHFRTVHGIGNEPEFTIRCGSGPLVAEGVFEIAATPAHRASTGESIIRVPYTARAFSPGLIVSEMAGHKPYSVVTAATPDAGRGCVIRLSLILPDGGGQLLERSRYLLEQSRLGLERDRRLWESIPAKAPFRLTQRDRSVAAFREFCRRMTGNSTGEESEA